MSDNLFKSPNGFDWGYTPITTIEETPQGTGINFGILRLKAGESKDISSLLESAYLLMAGKVTFAYDSQSHTVERASLFDEDPTALHFPANSMVQLTAETDCELSVSQVENDQVFPICLFDTTNMLESEHRGKGALEDTAYRIVRTIFDIRNRPDAKLVLGEVINFPGRWSSYPPHHHPQPEIYHYRFTKPQGYGHGELGDDVYKIRQFDTLKILDNQDHAQASGPGYGMYYTWIIRHLPNNPYTVPEFTEEHKWTMEKS